MTLWLDHTGLVVHDLDAGARQLASLGFSLTPRSDHAVPAPDGALRPAGTANHCAMLGRGYLELVAVTDPSADSFSRREIGGFVRRFEGLHLLAIGTVSAADTAGRLARSAAAELRDLRRQVPTPAGDGEARFRLVVSTALSGPDATVFFIEHATPDLLWAPGTTDHPNGALGLREVVVAVADIEAAAASYAEVLGVAPQRGDERRSFALRDSRLLLTSPSAAARHFEAALPGHALPHCAGQAVDVADLGRVAALLDANGVPFTRTAGRLTVAPAHACGAFLQFVGP